MAHVAVKWAQRKDRLFITVIVSSATNVAVDFQPTAITVTGTGIAAATVQTPQPFSTTINLQHAIAPEKSTYKVLGMGIQLNAAKKEEGPYWDRLTEQPVRATKQWLSVDWNLWRDEDEEAAPPTDFGGYGDLSNLMQGGGMGAMGDEDSDDEPPAAPLDDLDAPAAA